MKTIIMFAANKKEAVKFMMQDYTDFKFIGLYRHVSRGNNFYQFEVTQ